MSAVDKLIAGSRRGRAFTLTGAPLADLVKVLRSNAREPNMKHRVTIDAFVEHLRRQYRIKTTSFTLTRFVRARLKRGWYK